MTSDEKKIVAAQAALDYIKPNTVIGVGTGSTVNHFIDLLAKNFKGLLNAAVSRSVASTERMQTHGLPLSLIHTSDPTRQAEISSAVFCVHL